VPLAEIAVVVVGIATGAAAVGGGEHQLARGAVLAIAQVLAAEQVAGRVGHAHVAAAVAVVGPGQDPAGVVAVGDLALTRGMGDPVQALVGTPLVDHVAEQRAAVAHLVP
jgi:hypothetical protein